MRKNVPFEVSRNDARPLVRQVLDGMREAILGGYYAPGDEIPPYAELARLLGVSQIVTKAVLKRLGEDGLVLARPRIGTVVRDCGAKQWIGHVVLIGADEDDNYLQSILAGIVRDRLMEAGYLLTRASVRTGPDGKPDFTHLDVVLARSVDLVMLIREDGDIIRFLAGRKVPFAMLRETPRSPVGAVGFTHLDYNRAAREFALECARLGVGEVVEAYWTSMMCDVADECRKAGIAVRRMKIPVDFSAWHLVSVKRAGLEAFSKLASSGRLKRNAVYFIADDYLASGALLALAVAGVTIPEDVRVAVWSNTGLGPVFTKELSRMELDPAEAGATVAAATLEYLKTGRYPSGGVVGPKWVPGETMGGPS